MKVYGHGLEETSRSGVVLQMQRDGIEYEIIDLSAEKDYPELWKQVEEQRGKNASLPYPGIMTADGKLHITRNYSAFSKQLKQEHLPLQVYGNSGCYWTKSFMKQLDGDGVPYEFINLNRLTNEMFAHIEKKYGNTGGAYYPPVLVTADGKVFDGRNNYGDLLREIGAFRSPHGSGINPVPFFQFKGLDLDAEGIRQLKEIELYDWSKEELAYLSHAESLKSVYTQGRELQPADYGFFRRWKLESFRVNSNNFNDLALRQIAGIKTLQVLHISSTSITTRGLSTLPSLPSLRVLHLAGIRLDQAAMNQILRNRNLEELRLKLAYQQPGILSQITKLPGLRILDLSNVTIRPDDIRWLSELKQIEEIYVSNRYLSAGDIGQLKASLPPNTTLWVVAHR